MPQKRSAVETHADDDYDFSLDWMTCLEEIPSTSEPTGHENPGDTTGAETSSSPQESSKTLEEQLKRLVGADDLHPPTVEDSASQANSVASTLVAQTPGSSATAPDDNAGEAQAPKAKSKSTVGKSPKRSKPRQKRKIDEVDPQTAGQSITLNDACPVPLYTSVAESLCFNDRVPTLPEPPAFLSPLLKPGTVPIDPALLPRRYNRRKPPKSKVFIEEEEEECAVESSVGILPYPDLERSGSMVAEEEPQEYVCDACPKRFRTFRSLADHKNIHTGAKREPRVIPCFLKLPTLITSI